MSYKVEVTEDAYQDLCDIVYYIAGAESNPRALHVLEKIEAAISSLSENPKRGARVRELAELGANDFRELFFKPYRVIYWINGDSVFVMVATDGRRDMQTLLQRRLLEGM
jgi:toxin ParE1/3/4